MRDLTLLTLTGLPVLLATLKVAIIAATGFFLAHRKLLHETALRDLSALVVQVTVPCLVFSTAAQGLGALRPAHAALLIVSSPVIIGTGWLIGLAMHRLLRLDKSLYKPIQLPTSFANSSYLPIAVSTAVLPALAVHFPGVDPASIGQTSIVCISIYLVLYSPLFWGFAFWWMKGEAGGKLKIGQLFTPPVIGLALGYLVGLTPLRWALTPPHAPLHFVLLGIQDLGGLTIPLANLILGGLLYTALTVRRSEGGVHLMTPLSLTAAAIAKLVIVPAIIYAVLALTVHAWGHGGMLTLVAAIVLLESTTPGATNLAVMGGSVSESKVGMAISEILLVQYPLSIVTVPIWLTLFFGLLPH